MNGEPTEQHINVRVITTAGSYPEHGNEKVVLDEQIQSILARAAAQLSITDTADWVAKIKGEVIDPSRTYRQLGLEGSVKIDYGRREGAGG